jgi:hypothetical protein
MSIHLRAASLRPATFNAESRTIEAIVSTGAPVARPGYTEVLDLRGVDLSRLVGAPVLDGHRRDTTRDQLGVIEAARKTPEGFLLVVIRFRESTPAQAVMTDVANGTLRGLSIGYTIEQTRENKPAKQKTAPSGFAPQRNGHRLRFPSFPSPPIPAHISEMEKSPCRPPNLKRRCKPAPK